MKSKVKSSGMVNLKRSLKESVGVLAAIALIIVIMSFASPAFLSQDNIFNILRQIAPTAIIAFGMTFAILIGGIDLSVGSVQGFAGMAAVVAIITFGLPVWLGVIVGLTVGIVCGLFNGTMIALTKMPPFIVTMSMMSIARGFTYIISGGAPIRILIPEYNIIGTGVLGPFSYPLIYAIVLFAIFWFVLNQTKFGRHVYAVGGNQTAASFCGISIKKVQIIVFAISGFLAGVTGIFLTARLFTGQPTLGMGAELDAIAAVVIGGTSFSGGRGRLFGTFLGAILIGIIGNGMNLLNVSTFAQMVTRGFIILIAVGLDMYTRSRTQRVKKIKV